MENYKASIDFSTSRFSDAALFNKVNFIIDKMSRNENFPTPTPQLIDLKAANDLYIASLAKVENGTKEDTVIKNENRQAVTDLLKQLVTYVQATSKGNEAIILSSGFDVNRKPTSVGILNRPDNFIVKPGANKGSVQLVCDVVESAHFYEFEYIDANDTTDSKWIQKTSTKRRLVIEGLTSGKQYAFRVAAAGSNPARIWSEVLNSFVL